MRHTGSHVIYLQAKHVQLEKGRPAWLKVTCGENRTKNHQERRIPVTPRLEQGLKELLGLTPDRPLFTIKSPRFAFRNALRRLEMHYMRLYDLRHYFTNEAGVDIPTVAKWLGRAFLMNTYRHVRGEHGRKQAKLLR